jgi:glycosyltransferase involved in cell wall biosynthesis
MKHSYKNIGLMVFPLRSPEWQYFVDQILSFIVPPKGNVIVMTGNYYPKFQSKNTEVFNIKMAPILKNNESVISKISRFLRAQYYLSILVIKQRKKYDLVMLHLGTPYLIIPTFISYLMKKKIVVISTGSDSQSLRLMYRGILGKLLAGVVRLLENITYVLSDNIVVISDSMIPFLGIERFRHKIISGIGDSPLGGANAFIDTDKFCILRKWEDREDVIGYIGRLSAEKGITELVEAIPQIIKIKRNARFLIVGKGSLMDDLKKRFEIARCLDKVHFTGMIPHDNIPQILNRMKFLVVPSYTEVVATTALEAMACGTICLATAVGATKDVIIDGQTGFLLDDNKPATITEKLLEVWNQPELGKIQLNARKFIEDNFTQLKVTERWGIILDKVLS